MSKSVQLRVFVALSVVLFLFLVQSQPTHAKSLPFYEGLVLSYSVSRVWKSPYFGQGDYRINSNLTIQTLQNDGETVRLDYLASHKVTPPPNSDLAISATNFDKSEAKFQTSKDAFSIRSEVTLKDRTTIKATGDRAELVMVRATMRSGGLAEYKWTTEFPTGYATWLFIPADTSPGNVVPTFTRSDQFIVNHTLTLGPTETLSTRFGSLEAITCKSTSDTSVPQGIWHYNHSYYYSRPTGILLEYKSYGRLPRASGTPGEETLDYSLTLVGIEKAQSRLTVDSMPSEANVNSQIKASGRLYPAVGGKALDVTAKPDSGTEVSSRITTSQDGTFTVTFTPATAGSWTLRIGYAGDLTTGSSSVEKRFQVIGPRQTTTTIPTTETKTPAPDLSIAAVVGVAVLVAIIGIVVLRKRGKSAPAAP